MLHHAQETGTDNFLKDSQKPSIQCMYMCLLLTHISVHIDMGSCLISAVIREVLNYIDIRAEPS